MVLLPLLFYAQVALALVNWPQLSPRLTTVTRSQRDIAEEIPIDQLSTFGLSLNTLVFDKKGYTTDALDELPAMLAVGVQTFMLDLYWNEVTSKWQLCPAPFPGNATMDIAPKDLFWNGHNYTCGVLLTLGLINAWINTYIAGTNSNMDANYLQLLLNLKSIKFPQNSSQIYVPRSAEFASLGNSTLSDSVASLGSYIFTPRDLASFRNSAVPRTGSGAYYNRSDTRMPPLSIFLLNDFRRVLINVVSSDLDESSSSSYNISTQDRDTLFFDSTLPTVIDTADDNLYSSCLDMINGSDLTSSYSNVSLNTHFRFLMDGDDDLFTNETYMNYIRCGHSVILNSSEYVFEKQDYNSSQNHSVGAIWDYLLPSSYWSWAIGQPISGVNNTVLTNFTDDQPDTSDRELRAHCVALNPEGFVLSNCYDPFHYACQNESDPTDWNIPRDLKRRYFDAYKPGNCPDGYRFTLPRLSIELLALKARVVDDELPFPVWIDLNDITVSNCFVSGGPYAQCPYQQTVTRSQLVLMIAPSFVVAVVIIILIFMEKILRVTPIHTNRRRHWKHIINEYNEKHEYEGVPS
ncbi:uncharacterized protein CANTADRAFT_8237 [Suhomyces tanzawaensis NRRL Y-17324]|uniref:Maintenance of telomere capping protein 6 n=1 Tax=Suhomyces tanzawaensis NRRL Y-17324 TaxID=984487 RepID=A0A1E4SC19_9ASCO|nr:uncharacterized protein CANTADRAFT_8237 [Suhomyces tanzawaensis NRRL Y-17324]ODV77080.1 hypothetical protein CANTADRAFT_8237 [Suhomyces tanzawaensis NRRL Y-17324]